MRDKLIALLKQLSLHQDVHQITAEALAQAAHIPLRNCVANIGFCQNYPALIAFEQPNITRERILSAAMTVFAQKGWQKTSLDEVAAAAGMTKGAIYWHFRNKNDLFFALLDARLQRDTSPVKPKFKKQSRKVSVVSLCKRLLSCLHKYGRVVQLTINGHVCI
jgi:hypothetical protein